MLFRLPVIDPFSFLLGLILASLAWWIISILRPSIGQIRDTIRANQEKQKDALSKLKGVEERYLKRVLVHAQGLHLAAPLFSLDEIIEPPSLLAPPVRVEPGAPIIIEDIVEATIPYIPNWPDLGIIYNAPRITLLQALSGNCDIVLTGPAGIGKTVTMAYLASQLARKDPAPGLVPGTIPFLVHVADLDLPVSKSEPLNSIINLATEKAPIRDHAKIPELVRNAFSDGRALLLVDGADEITPDGLKSVVELLKALKRGFPKIRIVISASNDYLDGLVTLNFMPLVVSPWNSTQRKRFFEKWGNLWTNFVAVEAWAQTSDQIDPLLLNGWLNPENNRATPMELTLEAWSAYAGDLKGPGPLDSINAHLLRLTNENISREALEMLALQATLSGTPIFDTHTAHEWIKSFETQQNISVPVTSAETNGSKNEINQVPSPGIISKMVGSRILIQHRGN